ncbi:MAG TPA: zf-HC2 domain-containing protein [Actinomycetota bacterium]
MPDHPDHEQLAAFQAGDVDRRERLDVEAHLAGCASCAELVASVGHARASLALLEEPDLPPGLHDRLAAAVAAEPAAAAAGQAATPARRARGAATPWYRRPAAWGAAAALLVAALVIPFLNQSGPHVTTAGGDTGAAGGAREAATPAPSAAANLPVFRVQGEVTAATVRDRLDTDSRAKAALDSAASSTPQAATDQGKGTFRPDAGGASADAPQLQSCLPAATAAADPATRPLAPAFFIEGTYQGRAATILVTTSTAQPNRVDLWVFPRNSCSSPPLATERVR